MSLRVLFVRHAEAGLREEFKKTGRPDSSRPLTKKGEKDFKKVARVIQKLWPDIGLIASSPFRRTQQTAKILKTYLPKSRLLYLSELEPDSRAEELSSWLCRMGRVSTVALVGHEPELGHFLTYFLSGRRKSVFDFKKGGFALIEFENFIEKGTAKLVCSLQPSHLKKIRRVKASPRKK